MFYRENNIDLYNLNVEEFNIANAGISTKSVKSGGNRIYDLAQKLLSFFSNLEEWVKNIPTQELDPEMVGDMKVVIEEGVEASTELVDETNSSKSFAVKVDFETASKHLAVALSAVNIFLGLALLWKLLPKQRAKIERVYADLIDAKNALNYHMEILEVFKGNAPQYQKNHDISKLVSDIDDTDRTAVDYEKFLKSVRGSYPKLATEGMDMIRAYRHNVGITKKMIKSGMLPTDEEFNAVLFELMEDLVIHAEDMQALMKELSDNDPRDYLSKDIEREI